MQTALVVDDSAAARHRVATLLELGGWRVHQAVGTDAALRLATVVEPDLVVTAMAMRDGHGATLMRRLREQGSRARFLVVTSRRTQQVRALAAASGALACLAKPVAPRLFVDIMRALTPAPAPPGDSAHRAGSPALPGDDTSARAEEMYVSALPHRLSSMAAAAREGDAESVAVTAEVLAAGSANLGYAEIAFVSTAIAQDARRGIVAHTRLMTLVGLCARLESGALVGQALTSA